MKENCTLCSQKLEETFLGKFEGTIITTKGKKHYICKNCQKEHKETLSEKIS